MKRKSSVRVKRKWGKILFTTSWIQNATKHLTAKLLIIVIHSTRLHCTVCIYCIIWSIKRTFNEKQLKILLILLRLKCSWNVIPKSWHSFICIRGVFNRELRVYYTYYKTFVEHTENRRHVRWCSLEHYILDFLQKNFIFFWRWKKIFFLPSSFVHWSVYSISEYLKF